MVKLYEINYHGRLALHTLPEDELLRAAERDSTCPYASELADRIHMEASDEHMLSGRVRDLEGQLEVAEQEISQQELRVSALVHDNARLLELVRALAEEGSEPVTYASEDDEVGRCGYCGCDGLNMNHRPSCLVLRARNLLGNLNDTE